MPKLCTNCLVFTASKGFVKISAVICSLAQYRMSLSFDLNSSFTKWYLMSICFLFGFGLSFCSILIQFWLSSKITTGLVMFMFKSFRILLIQMDSCTASASATYSASVDDNVTIDCLWLVHATVAPLYWKQYPVFDFLSAMSAPQSASTYTINSLFSCSSGLPSTSFLLIVCFKYLKMRLTSVQSFSFGSLTCLDNKETPIAMSGLVLVAMYCRHPTARLYLSLSK